MKAAKVVLQISDQQLNVLGLLAKQTKAEPMRVLAKQAGIPPQQLAVRIWRLRQKGLAAKPGPERYRITKLGREVLAAGT
jgi:predicted transcriptional regulator